MSDLAFSISHAAGLTLDARGPRSQYEINRAHDRALRIAQREAERQAQRRADRDARWSAYREALASALRSVAGTIEGFSQRIAPTRAPRVVECG
jgi:hypothetical protein